MPATVWSKLPPMLLLGHGVFDGPAHVLTQDIGVRAMLADDAIDLTPVGQAADAAVFDAAA